MQFWNDNLIKEGLVIGGGLDTAAHAADRKSQPDSYRLDFDHTEGIRRCMVDQMDFVMEASNNDKLGTRYAVYHFKVGNVDYYIFYVEIFNPRRGTLKRGDIVYDFSSQYAHVHIKEGSYAASNGNYLHYLPYFDTRVGIRDNWGGSAYNGLNKGEQIPDGIIVTNQDMATLQREIKIKTTNTAALSIRATPDRSKPAIGSIPNSQEFTTKEVAGGENISGNSTWYKITYNGATGYISGYYVQELSQVDQATVDKLSADLDAANQAAAALKVDNDNLHAELSKYQPITFYQKQQ